MRSSIGQAASPGASLRAFRDMLPDARVFGADLDRTILFSEDRIETTFVDQLKPATLETLYATFGSRPFDLVVDDGLHGLASNLVTLNFALRHVNAGGFIVIEDVSAKLTVIDGPRGS
jgi:hypothetical protein